MKSFITVFYWQDVSNKILFINWLSTKADENWMRDPVSTYLNLGHMVDLQRIYRRVHRAEGRRKGICHSEEQCKGHLPLMTLPLEHV